MLHVTRLTPAPCVLVDETGRELLEHCHRTDGVLSRSVGLLGTRRLDPGRGLWISPCSSIHMLGMAYPIDAAFLDGDDRVIEVRRVRPWGFARVSGARSVIEAVPGVFDAIAAGVTLRLLPVPHDANGAVTS